MRRIVMEDGRYRVRSVKRSRTWMARGVALSALVVCAGLSSPAVAQQEFRASVIDMASGLRHVRVPLNRSVIIETTIEVGRADVVNDQIADIQPVSAKQLLITGKGYGSTNVILWDKSDQQYVLEVSTELDLARFNEILGGIDRQANVKATSVMGNIVLTGTVSSAEKAKRMVELANLFLPPSVDRKQASAVQNHMTVAGEQQVLLRCVVAEVNRTAVRTLGINGFLAGDNVRDAFLVNQLGGINPINIGAAADALVNQRIPFLTGEDGIPISSQPSISLGFPRVQMQIFMKAMADNSLAKVLAEPNLVAVSGETASFLAGGEFPIPVPQGVDQVTIEFRQFGVRLNFTPIVKGNQQIRLRVAPEVSELDFTAAVQIEGFVVPGLSSRSAETTVELGSGQTIAIAGLLSEEVRGLASQVPGVGDIPILGALFRSVDFQRSASELVILVTPEIVAPLDKHQKVRVPGENIQDPSDFELYALGLLEGTDPALESAGCKAKGGSASAQQLESEPDEPSVHGPWGHADETEAR